MMSCGETHVLLSSSSSSSLGEGWKAPQVAQLIDRQVAFDRAPQPQDPSGLLRHMAALEAVRTLGLSVPDAPEALAPDESGRLAPGKSEPLAPESALMRCLQQERAKAARAEAEVARLQAALGEASQLVEVGNEKVRDTVRHVLLLGWANITWRRGYTALHLAAEHGCAEVLPLLVVLGADPEAGDIASAKGHTSCVDVLARLEGPHASQFSSGQALATPFTQPQSSANSLAMSSAALR